MKHLPRYSPTPRTAMILINVGLLLQIIAILIGIFLNSHSALDSVCLRGVSYYQQGSRIVAPMFNQDGSLVLCLNSEEN